MQRILVIGSGGSGKSSLAIRLAKRMALPLIHLDAHYWRAGWIEPSKQEWLATVESLLAGERWIMDGNYGGTLGRRLSVCDTVIFLDLSRWLCLWRVIGRHIRYRGRARPDMTEGCHERMDWGFLWWIISYPGQRRPSILQRLAGLRPGQRAVVLRSRREVEEFLLSVSPSETPGA